MDISARNEEERGTRQANLYRRRSNQSQAKRDLSALLTTCVHFIAALITLPLLIAKGKNQPLVASIFLQTSNKVPLGVSVRAPEIIRFACGIFKIPLSK